MKRRRRRGGTITRCFHRMTMEDQELLGAVSRFGRSTEQEMFMSKRFLLPLSEDLWMKYPAAVITILSLLKTGALENSPLLKGKG